MLGYIFQDLRKSFLPGIELKPLYGDSVVLSASQSNEADNTAAALEFEFAPQLIRVESFRFDHHPHAWHDSPYGCCA